MSNYILDLRKSVGHQTIIQCAASIIIVNDLGQILLGRRTDNHKLSYAGGSVEIDEKVEDCARRELLEEMGLVANEIEFFMINSGKEVHYIYPNDDEVSNIEIIYVCRNYQGTMKAQEEEMEELAFWNLEDIDLEEISPPIRPVIQKYIEVYGSKKKAENAMQMKIDHIAMYVNELEKTRDFFVKYFGANSNDGYHNKNTNFKSYFLTFKDGMRLEIMNHPDVQNEPKTLRRTGLIHIAFSVGSKEKVDELTARLKADGYEVISGPRTTGDGYYESCIIGIEGNQIEITI